MLLLLLLLLSCLPAEACIPTSPAAMPPIPCQTCPTTAFVATGFTTDNAMASGCVSRTLTCGAATSTSTLIRYNGATDITGSGTLTFVVTCNPANTAWLYMGTPVSQAVCSEPCQTCPAFTATGFANDVPSSVGGCSVRTLTCGSATSTSTLIRYNGATDIMGSGMLTFAVTCNAANTAWLYMGTPVSQAVCSQPCQACSAFTATGFANDVPSSAGGCSVRTLTCGSATSTSTLIRYNGATDITGSGMLTFAVTCNPANTAWLYMGTPISQAVCSEPCQTCPAFTATGFANDVPSSAGGCSVRTLTCGSATSTSTLIRYNGATSIPGSSMQTFAVTCNAANTAWLYMGTPVSQAECSEPCQSCPAFTATGFANDVPSSAGGCKTRRLTCGTGPTSALIRYNGATDITGTGPLMFLTTCNAPNTAWLYMAATSITQAQCIIPCKTACVPSMISHGPECTNAPSTGANGCAGLTITCAKPITPFLTKVFYYYNANTMRYTTPIPLIIPVTCNGAAWIWNSPPGGGGPVALTSIIASFG